MGRDETRETEKPEESIDYDDFEGLSDYDEDELLDSDEENCPKFKLVPTFLAFPCFHLYTNAQVFPKKKDSAKIPLTSSQVAALKGKDAVLGKAVLAAAEMTGGCVKIHLQPMLDHEYTEDPGAYLISRFPTPKFKVPRRMSDDSIEEKFKTTGRARFYDDGYKDIDPIWVLDDELGHKPDKIGETEWNADGYFGNEASFTYFYIKSFLRVEFAPYDERKKLIEKANQPTDESKKRAVGRKGKGKGKGSRAPKKAKVDE